MSSVVPRPPLLSQLLTLVRSASRRLLNWVRIAPRRLLTWVRSASWQIVGRLVLWLLRHRALGPLLTLAYMVQACVAAFGPRPRMKVPPGCLLSGESMQLTAKLHEHRSASAHTEITDRQRAVAQSMTWGAAGAAVLILVAIATSSKTFSGAAMTVAATCFAVSIPLFIALGFAYSSHQNEATESPTPNEALNLHHLLRSAQFLFGLGLAALLWSFDRRVSIAFVVACYLGWRAFMNLVVFRVGEKAAAEVSAMLEDAMRKSRGKGEVEQPHPDASRGDPTP